MVRALGRINLFAWLLFFYFVTLHADQLNVALGGYTIRLSNLLALILIILVVGRLRTHLLPINKWLAYPLLLIALSMTISLVLSPYKVRCGFYLGWYGLTVLCYVLLPYCIMKMWDEAKIFSLYQASFICVGLYAALQLVLSFVGIRDPFASQFITGQIVRPNGFCFEPSFYALYMTPFVFFYNANFVTSTQKKSFWALLGINFLYLISTSTAVIFAYGAFFIIICCMPGVDRKRLMKFVLFFCGCALFLFILFPFIAKQFFLKFFFQGFMAHHSFYERWIGIENGWNIFLQHPLFGVGIGGYPCYLMDAFLRGDTTFSYLSSQIGELDNPVKMFEAMNVFTELLASLGLVGLCVFGALLYGIFVQVKGAYAINKNLALSLLSSLIVTIIIFQFNQGLFRTYIWTHLALCCAYLEKLALSNKVIDHEHPAPLYHTT